MDIVLPPMLALQAKAGSFPFASKYIPLPANVKAVLGSVVQDTNDGATSGNRSATSTNGWFAPRRFQDSPNPISPISLSPNHAEIWSRNGQVSRSSSILGWLLTVYFSMKIFIKDLNSPFGTYVNGMRINGTVALKNDDTLVSNFCFAHSGTSEPFAFTNRLLGL